MRPVTSGRSVTDSSERTEPTAVIVCGVAATTTGVASTVTACGAGPPGPPVAPPLPAAPCAPPAAEDGGAADFAASLPYQYPPPPTATIATMASVDQIILLM